ncbi:MAG: hypothetical protein ACRDWI_12640 [Jiangellaceae bacterium]
MATALAATALAVSLGLTPAAAAPLRADAVATRDRAVTVEAPVVPPTADPAQGLPLAVLPTCVHVEPPSAAVAADATDNRDRAATTVTTTRDRAPPAF